MVDLKTVKSVGSGRHTWCFSFLFQDFFVFLVEDDFVFVVINHLRNLSNLYISDTEGVKYQLSLSRVLYHNPFTDVSSPWLR